MSTASPKHSFPFDPTYGYDLDALRRVPSPPGPADFAEFWTCAYAEARQVPLRIARRRVASPDPRVEVWEVEFDALDGVRIGGWINVPADGVVTRGVVLGHGYGGRGDVPAGLFTPAAAAIYPCARGFHRSAHPAIPGESGAHVVTGIARRETYVLRGCASDLWCAASVLTELYPQVAARLHYQGGSFGGGLGALMLPWDARFSRAYLDVPTFGNHPLRVTLPCTGSGEAVRRLHAQRPEVLEVLAYFDAATAARHIRIPVFCAAARFDPAVPPPGQFAVYNALAGPKDLFVRGAAHFATPGEARENEEIDRRLQQWFRD